MLHNETARHPPRGRFLQFVCALLQRLTAARDEELSVAARVAYDATLRPFHGFLSSSVFVASAHSPRVQP